MNIILFDPAETDSPLPPGDHRAQHIREVLRLGEGDSFDAGILNGPVGRAVITDMRDGALRLEFSFTGGVPSLYPVTLVLGFPRPIYTRRILRDLTTLGVERILLTATEKGERSYRDSRIWKKGEYLRYLREGAEQAFSTRVPEVSFHRNLSKAIESAKIDAGRSAVLVALDNRSAEGRFSDLGPIEGPAVLAVGSERGWSDAERDIYTREGFAAAHLGSRVLRTETACISAVTLVLSAMGLM